MKEVHGIFLPSSERHFAEHPALGRRYPVLDIVDQHIKQRRVALDIGAHVGLFSRWLVDSFIWVNAFEPVEEHRRCFEKNLRNNTNYALFAMALSDRYEMVGMKLYPEDTGCAHIARDVEGHIRAAPLDDMHLDSVDLIKIDVEGYELRVLRGATRTLLRCKPIVIMENRGHGQKHFGEHPMAAIYFLESLGASLIESVGDDVVMGFPYRPETLSRVAEPMLEYP